MQNNPNNLFSPNFRIGKSKIHGNGVIANRDIQKDQIIAIPIVFYLMIIPTITQDFGKWINHSYNENSYLHYDSKNHCYFLVAKKNIPKNQEITANYNNTPWFIKKPESHYV